MKLMLTVVAALFLALIVAACEAPSSTDDSPASTASSGIAPSTSTTRNGSAGRTNRESPPPTETEAAIMFPTRGPNASGDALLIGELVEASGCLFVRSDNDATLYLIVWPRGFTWSNEGNVIRIHNEAGDVVARDGDTIEMAGGVAGFEIVNGGCSGMIWEAAGPVTVHDQDPIPSPTVPAPTIPFPQTTTPSAGDAELVGTLVQSNGCLRVDAREGDGRYLVVWPPSVAPTIEHGSVVLHDSGSRPVGWIGAELRLRGEAVTELSSEISIQEPPVECAGPYWIAGPSVQLIEFVADEGQSALLDPDNGSLTGAIEYATTYQITLAEAVRRLELQHLAGPLVEELRANESETFAGFWVEHEPTFRFIVRFTHGGEETIRPYVEGTELDGLIKVRNGARWTETELEAKHERTIRILRELGFNPSSELTVPEDRITVWVADREAVGAALAEADIQLPETVELIDIDEQGTDG